MNPFPYAFDNKRYHTLAYHNRQQIEHYSDVGILYQKRYTFVRVEDGNASELADEWDRVTQVLKGCGYDLGRIPIVVKRV